MTRNSLASSVLCQNAHDKCLHGIYLMLFLLPFYLRRNGQKHGVLQLQLILAYDCPCFKSD